MNTQVNLRTKISPTQLIFGNTVNHDSHFLSEPIDNNLDDSATQYMNNLLTIQQRIIKIALDNQEENDTHQISVRQNEGNYKQTFHKYFNENQMRKFIPPEFTWGKHHPDYEPPTKRSRK